MLQATSRQMRKLLFILTAAAIVLLVHPGGAGLQKAFADPVVTMQTSQMTTGKDYYLSYDTILLIDQSISIGKIFTGNHALTIRGSSDTALTTTRIASGSSSANHSAITLESGHVKVETNSDDGYDAVYTSNVLEIKGGKMDIQFFSYAPSRPAAGINADIFRMSGGELNIVSRTGDSTSAHGICIYRNDPLFPSYVSGGTLTVTGEIYGLTLYNNTQFSVTGGTVQFFGGLSSSTGNGVNCYADSTFAVSGGRVTTRGGSCGIYGHTLLFSGKAWVSAEGNNNYGIQASEMLTIKDRAIVTAKGQNAAVITKKDGFSIESKYGLYIEKPVNGYVAYSAPSQYIFNSNGSRATSVLINYRDAVGDIVVSAIPANVTKGKSATVKCTAAVSGYSHDDLALTWMISGNNSSDTKITSSGVLTIAADEPADQITVRAVAKADTSKTGDAVVRLTDPPAPAPADSSGTSAGDKTESGQTASGGSSSGGSSSGGNTSGGNSSGKQSEEDKILAGVKKEDAKAVKNQKGSKKISAATVNKLPVNKKLPKVKAAKIVTKGSLRKKTMTVYYNKVKGATNYIIAWKKASAKKWNYYTTGNKGSFVIKGLKRKSLVQFKVAPYAKGKRGAWSVTRYRYFENAAVTTVRKGATLTVTFKKVKGATGYQLLSAGNKKMTGYKLTSVKGKTKIVLKKLNKKKAVYIRWRPYKVYKGKKYTGLLQSVKAVKP